MTHPLTTLRTVDQDPISAMLWADEITDPDDRTMAIQYLCGHLPLAVEKWDEGVRMARAAVWIGAAEEWDGGLVEGIPQPLLRWLMADCAEVGIPTKPLGDDIDARCLRLARKAKKALVKGWLPYSDDGVDGLSGDLSTPQWCGVWAANAWPVVYTDFRNASECPGYPYVLRRLTYLCKAWAVCGEKAPALLYEGRCPIDWEDTP